MIENKLFNLEKVRNIHLLFFTLDFWTSFFIITNFKSVSEVNVLTSFVFSSGLLLSLNLFLLYFFAIIGAYKILSNNKKLPVNVIMLFYVIIAYSFVSINNFLVVFRYA